MTHRSAEDIRQHFEDTLDEIRRGTVALGSLVLENTKRLGEALLENRLDLALEVVEADREIDERYIDLEQRVFEVMARQAPVAGDLRFLVSITRLLYEIERSGDLAVNAAHGLLERDGYELPSNIHGLLARACRGACDLFAEGIQALAELDAEAGPVLDEHDDEVDDTVGELYAVIGKASDELGFDTAVEVSRVGRYLERIADHAVNIAQHVTFIVTGSFPEDGHGHGATRDEG
jgi:phosphate transport system protein